MKAICVTNLTVRGELTKPQPRAIISFSPGRQNCGGRHALSSRIPIPVLRQTAQAWIVKASFPRVVAMLLADIFPDRESQNMTPRLASSYKRSRCLSACGVGYSYQWGPHGPEDIQLVVHSSMRPTIILGT
jgi:hypothetical protein